MFWLRKKFECKKIILSEQLLGPKNTFCTIKVQFWSKENLCPNIFSVKKDLGVQNILGQKRFWIQKNKIVPVWAGINLIVKTPTPTQHNTTVGFDMKMTVQTPPPQPPHPPPPPPPPQKLFSHFQLKFGTDIHQTNLIKIT